MADEWNFWREEIAGRNPETTPGVPHAGYYINRNRFSYPNPNPGPGKPRRNVRTVYEPCAIWKDADGWHCLIHGEQYEREFSDIEKIDEIFSYVCRSAIPHDEYELRVAEMLENYLENV